MKALLTVLILIVASIFVFSFFASNPAGVTDKGDQTTKQAAPAPAPTDGGAKPDKQTQDNAGTPENPSAPADDTPSDPDTATPRTATAPDNQPPVTEDSIKAKAEIEAAKYPPIEELKVRSAQDAVKSTLGSTDPEKNKLEIQITGWGAAIYRISSAVYKQDVHSDAPLVIQSQLVVADNDGNITKRMYPFAARSIVINNGDAIGLEAVKWVKISEGQYEVTIVDAQEKDILRITRSYTLGDADGGYDITCKQSFENLSGRPLKIRWEQYGQGELSYTPNYAGDKREYIAGYYDLDNDPNKVYVYVDDTVQARATVLEDAAKKKQTLWPSENVDPLQSELVWIGSTNRYFATAIHQVPPAPAPEGQRNIIAPLDQLIARQEVKFIGKINGDDDQRMTYVVLHGRDQVIAAGETASLDLALYAGPRDSDVFAKYPYDILHLSELVVYQMSSCAFCTFQPLARFLLGFLKYIHIVVQDWGVAIIILVLCVRGLLHPITKKSQVNMMKMSKAMQAMQPEIEKLKKKYEDNPQKIQQEQMRLFREKGVNPFNMLGCLPMFLQMPIWIALYAMLYFAIELFHQPAFYGVFQSITGDSWHFLSDLSAPDGFIPLGTTFTIPMLGPTSTINILPLLMGVVFYINQKMTTPPPANEQAAQQQKIMKYMTLLFPIFLYNAPSGLTLYILSSTGAGIVDSYFVRKHIREQEEAGTLFDKKPSKPGGLRDRLSNVMERKQKQMEEMQKAKQGGGNKGGGSGPKRRRKK